MTGEKAGFVNLLTKEIAHTVIGFYCIIHEEALCAKAGLRAFQEILQTVTKVLNCIYVRALHQKYFQCLQMEIKSVYKGLKMYNNV